MKNQISNTSASHALGTGVCGVRTPPTPTHTRASFDSSLGTITKLQVVPENKGLQLTTLAACCYSSLSAEKASRMMKLLVMHPFFALIREKEEEEARRLTTTSAEGLDCTHYTNDRKTCNEASK